MGKVKRYNNEFRGMLEHEHGDFVLASEYKAASEQLAALAGGFVELLMHKDKLAAELELINKDYAELKAQRDALAAENAALISVFSPKEISTEATDNLDDTAILKIDGDEFHSWQWIDNQDDVIRSVLDFFKPKTPATDAYLNSVRAEVLPADVAEIIDSGNLESILFASEAPFSEQYRMAFYKFRQLRAGEPS